VTQLSEALRVEGYDSRPHFRHPFGRSTLHPGVTFVEQDTAEHILSCEGVIVACPQGFRDDRPDFGVPWPEYRTRPSGEDIAHALRKLEPRSVATAETWEQPPGTTNVNVNVET